MKKVATAKQRRAYRSVSTKAQRQATREGMGKGEYAKFVARTGKALRKTRKAGGFNPDTGKKSTATTYRIGASGGGVKATQVSYSSPAAKAKGVKRASQGKTGPTAKTKTVRRIAERKGISRAAANKIRKERKS